MLTDVASKLFSSIKHWLSKAQPAMNFHSNFILMIIAIFSFSPLIVANNDLDQLIDNSDITWAAEVYTDYVPNVNNHEIGTKIMKTRYGISYNRYAVLKIQNEIDNNNIGNIPSQLAYKLLHLKSNNFNVFSDASLGTALNYEAYQKIVAKATHDTIITFDPETFEEIEMVTLSEFSIVEVFRVKQIIHYNSKTKQLGLTPIALAPLKTSHSSNHKLTSKKPMFWLPIKEATAIIDIKSATINWAKRLNRSIHSNELTVIKGTEALEDILYDIFKSAKQHPQKVKLYTTSGKLTRLNVSDIKTLGHRLDTVSIFDPNSISETIAIVERKITTKSFENLHIIQNWVWDQKTQQMSIQLIAFAPIITYYDDYDEFLDSRVLFYKKPNE